MQTLPSMPVSESVYAYLIPPFADLLTGFGLSTLLEFSRTSPELHNFIPISVGAVLAAGAVALWHPFRVPAWVSLCNSTFSLVITLSLALNLFSQLCPPNGKELSLIPVYVILCVPRMSPSGYALAVQCGLTVFLICVFLILPISSHVRPEGDVGTGVSLAVSVTAGSLLQTFSLHPDEYMIFHPNFQQSRWWCVLGVVGKGTLLVVMGAVSNTSLYHFMYDRFSTVPNELFIGYGILVLFACVQAAAVWFGNLKEVMGRHANWRLVVRIQHIINALIVAAAWVYPLQLHALRVLLLAFVIILNVFHGLFS
jgi:hypothetical protein